MVVVGLKRIFILVGAVACLVAAFLIVWASGLPERTAYTGFIAEGERYAPEMNALAPLFDGRMLNGQLIPLADLRGKVVLINFWATWCEPCWAEMPDLQTIYEDYHSRGLAILGVNLDEGQSEVSRWVQQLGLTFDIVIDEGQQIASVYQLRGQPSSYLVAPDGVIKQIYYGPTTRERLEAAIAPLLPA